jgi:transglutaminase-like putative cysteine protease
VATRFVSGYLYDAALDVGAETTGDAVTGAGTTHAWLHAYLPGAGWVAYDPTNNLTGSGELIRVAVARDPSLAAPISGTWYGDPEAYEGLDASVVVRRLRG